MKLFLHLFIVFLLSVFLSGCGDDLAERQNQGDLTSQDSAQNADGSNGDGEYDITNMQSNGGLQQLPIGGDDSEGNPQSDTNYNYRFQIFGDVNTTIGDNFYPLKAAFDYRGIAFPSGYTFDPIMGVYHIQIAGHDIHSDKWNQETGSIMLKFDMKDMQTTGTYKLKYPANASGEVTIYHIESHINDSYIIVGSISNAQIYNHDKSATVNISTFFKIGAMPLYK